MKSIYWDNGELSIYEQWDWAMSYTNTIPSELITNEDQERIIYLQARLLISNKLLIKYNDKKCPDSIISFKEFLEQIELYGFRNCQLKYSPVNFHRIDEFRQFISHIRDEIFAHLKV